MRIQAVDIALPLGFRFRGYDAVVVQTPRDEQRYPDDILLERMSAGDESALRALVERYGPLVFGVTRRVLVDAALAEEIAQDTFLTLWRKPEMFDARRSSLASFLALVARNKAVDAVRKEESRRRTRQRAAAEAAVTVAAEEPIDDVVERRVLVDALNRLPEGQREALMLAYFGGRTYREVAEELGIPEGTVKSRMREGLARLREALTAQRRR